MTQTSTPRPERSKQRTDIQGLRTVAVLLVVAQHFWDVPRGGFVGVDIFFVISGFLISSIILKDIRANGHFNLKRFYARRIRRIVPVALLVTIVTIAASWLIWFTPQALQYTLDGFWSTLWVANWHFAGIGTDYLAHSATPSPFQHYWSLSVEEQFYLVWPLLLAALFALTRSEERLRTRLLVFLGAAIALSFAWAVLFTQTKPTYAYFDTVSRAFEFALGALAAQLSLPQWGRAWLPWLGLAGLAASAVWILPTMAFPGPYAIVPALSAALVLIGPGSGTSIATVLGNRLFVWIGDISYSVYLWHFPVLILGRQVLGRSALSDLVLLAAVFALSVLSYLFVEDPIRKSSWLRSWEKPVQEQRRAGRHLPSPLLSALVIGVVAAFSVWQVSPSKFGVLAPQTVKVERASATEVFSTHEQVQAAMADQSKPWSSLVPSPNALNQNQLGYAMAPGTPCAAAYGDTQLGTCQWPARGEKKRAVLVLGDSVALAWTPAVLKAVDEHTEVIAAGVGSCSIMGIRQDADFKASGFAQKCDATREALLSLIDEKKPQTVIIASAAGGYTHQLDASGAIISNPAAQRRSWEAGASSTLKAIAAKGVPVLVLGSPGLTADPRSCMNRLTGTGDCAAPLTEAQKQKEAAEQTAVDQARKEGAKAVRVDMLAQTCIDENGTCPLAVGPYLTHTDPTHITQAFAESLAPFLQKGLDELRKQG